MQIQSGNKLGPFKVTLNVVYEVYSLCKVVCTNMIISRTKQIPWIEVKLLELKAIREILSST